MHGLFKKKNSKFKIQKKINHTVVLLSSAFAAFSCLSIDIVLFVDSWTDCIIASDDCNLASVFAIVVDLSTILFLVFFCNRLQLWRQLP